MYIYFLNDQLSKQKKMETIKNKMILNSKQVQQLSAALHMALHTWQGRP